jgi:hypothetical protein
MEFKWIPHDDYTHRMYPKVASKELYLYGEHHGLRKRSYIGLVDYSKGRDDWRVLIHESLEDPHLRAIENMRFKSRSSAMRELRKRFTIAWIGATADQRNDIWDEVCQ